MINFVIVTLKLAKELDNLNGQGICDFLELGVSTKVPKNALLATCYTQESIHSIFVIGNPPKKI